MKKVQTLYFFVIFTFMLILVIQLSIQSVRNIRESQFEERINHITILTEKMNGHVKNMTDFNWETLHFIKEMIEFDEFSSEEDAVQKIASLGEKFNRTIWMIDQWGQCYTENGYEDHWQEKDLLISDKDEFLTSDSQSDANEDLRLYYLTPLSHSVKAGKSQFTHVVLVMNLSDIHPHFDISNSFDENSMAFIIKSDGTHVYRHNDNNHRQLFDTYNLLAVLKDATYNNGADFQKVQSDIRQGKNGVISVTINHINYYMDYFPLAVDGLSSLLLIPEENVGVNIEHFSKIFFHNMTVIFCGFIALLVVVIGWIFFNIHLKQYRVTEQLRQNAEAERAANIAKTNFFSSISHDIRTPMNAIVSVANLAQKRTEDAAYMEEALSNIKIASNQLLRLINDILDVSKIESGSMTLSKEPFSVRELIDNSIFLVQSEAEKKQHTLTVEMHDIVCDNLKGDYLRLSQVYLNLLSNAIKYTHQNGTIRTEIYEEKIESRKDKIRLCIVVEDNGVGINKAFQKQMYTPFAREKDKKMNRVQGTGLGLSICKELVELMGSHIQCDSEVGKGTTFTVKIELDTGLNEKNFVLADPNQPKQSDFLKELHLLVAEDNDLNWQIASEILAYEGITCERAEDGRACLDLLSSVESNHFDAILMDIEMPIMDGYEASRRIRASQIEWIRTIPIFAMTASTYTEDIQSCLNAGMNAHIAKPINMEELLRYLSSIESNQKERMADGVLLCD